jgi:hypothetical protein
MHPFVLREIGCWFNAFALNKIVEVLLRALDRHCHGIRRARNDIHLAADFVCEVLFPWRVFGGPGKRETMRANIVEGHYLDSGCCFNTLGVESLLQLDRHVMEDDRVHAFGSTHVVERHVHARLRELLQLTAAKTCNADRVQAICIRPLDRLDDVR